tara:strand:+ start:161 stop:334 length:174 start_codon:yes stop_codon:yes gene_type:complete
MKYKSIKWILKQQIDRGSFHKWAWIKEPEEFICVHEIIPDVEYLYTPKQLLNKIQST